jgi:hypothetical protein
LGSNNIPLTISKKSNEQTTCARQTHRGDGSSLEPLYLSDQKARRARAFTPGVRAHPAKPDTR